MDILYKYLKLFWVFALVIACSPQGGPLNSGYHNVTSHYNAYFIAFERMKEIETQVFDKYEWNYNKVLPIYPQFDSLVSKGLESLTEDCIQKASIAIQRHEGSRWEDDSYVLVGKARFYASEFPDAIETFKYVNKKGEDNNTRHDALINLIRTFVESNEINNAIAVSDYLKKEKLSDKNLFDLHLARAYMFQKRGDNNQMVQNLVLAEELLARDQDKARIQFIIGQVYQELGFDAEAYKFYVLSLKNNPSYELSFYTKLNMGQVTQLTKNNDVKKVRKYFKKLLRDPKNLEYQDKIYYEMASFEFKNGNLNQAIELYKSSVQKSVKNNRQKAYSYWKIGQIYYDSLKNFALAKSYYDSTVSVMPQDEDEYATIKQRQEVLSEFVEHITTVHVNDSLIALSYLSVDSTRAIARIKVEQEFENERQKKKRAKEKARREQMSTSFDRQGGDLINANLEPGDTWYFYNPAVMGRGLSEFKRVWGNRPLEDNWRRSSKASGVIIEDAELKVAEEVEETADQIEVKLNEEIDKLLANIPRTESQMKKLLDEIEAALYQLGNIYNFKLEENENAISSFEQLLSRYNETAYKPEVLYQLYLLYGQLKQLDFASERAKLLKEQFPESIYAKLIDNPNYREDSHAATTQLQTVYKKAYNLYSVRKFKEAKYLLDSALEAHPSNDFSDNLRLLDVKAIGMLEGLYKYQYELNNFIKTYPESDVVDYANVLLKASEDYQINIVNSAKARFIEYFDQKHYMVIAYPNKNDLSESIPNEVDAFMLKSPFNYTSGNLILDDQYAMVLINDIPNKTDASEILNAFASIDIQNAHKGEKIYTFIISQDNFDIFYQTKDLNAYLNFYERMYQ
ncbi:MAG: tetratricopeptide (TPR) repeat protein [Cyclobacteriaceae bacterium]